tara:strand:- start:271 stop:849 length:579 start_codon:yes stop_codon:yes gene_type:complete
MIPKKIHYVCKDGYDNLPDAQKEWIEFSKKNNLDFKIFVWDDLPNKNIEYTKFHIIYNEGGICLDSDISVNKIPEDWLSQNVIISKENDWSLSSNIIGGTKKSKFFKKCLDSFSEKDSISEFTKNSLCQAYGKYFIENSKDGKLKSNNIVKFLEKPKLQPHNLLEKINNLDYFKLWDNYTSNQNLNLEVKEI